MEKKAAPKKRAAAKKAAPTAEPTAEAAKYTVIVDVNEVPCTVSGETILEALRTYEVPPLIKTRLVITVKSGEQSVEHIVPVLKARRVLQNHNALELLASNLSKQLG